MIVLRRDMGNVKATHIKLSEMANALDSINSRLDMIGKRLNLI